MKQLLFIVLIFFTISCSPKKEISQDNLNSDKLIEQNSEEDYKQIYLNEFKLFYFKSCLKHGFDNNESIKALNNIDNSGYAEPILGMTYLTIDSLAKFEYKKMYRAEGEVAEGAEGMHVYSTCLTAYTSKWLDSLARIKIH